MAPDPEFTEAVRFNAVHRWKWRRPWLAAILGTIPLGMIYTSIGAAVLYFVLSAAWLSWDERPRWGSILIMLAFGTYAYHTTRWRNAAIEHCQYGLPGTGTQNPKGMTPINGSESREARAA